MLDSTIGLKHLSAQTISNKNNIKEVLLFPAMKPTEEQYKIIEGNKKNAEAAEKVLAAEVEKMALSN